MSGIYFYNTHKIFPNKEAIVIWKLVINSFNVVLQTPPLKCSIMLGLIVVSSLGLLLKRQVLCLKCLFLE